MSDRKIVKCAERIVRDLLKENYYTMNGEYNASVKRHIKRMRDICFDDLTEKADK